MDTKACNLTEDEIRTLIGGYGLCLNDKEEVNKEEYNMERINYLHKRLKTFKEPEKGVPSATEPVKEGW